MAGRTCVTTTRVRFGETDAAGIVFYPTFFAWFDLGVQTMLRDAPGGLLADGRMRYPVPIVEAGARFTAPLFFDDAIAIRTVVASLGTSSMRFEHVVERDGVEVASGFEVRVLVDSGARRIAAVALPDDLRAYLGAGADR